MDAHHQVSARPLGAVEVVLAPRSKPIHFVTAAVIEGTVPIDTWQDCLDELGWATPRIWSGIYDAPGEQPRFAPVTKLSIPLRRVGGSISDLADVVQYELRTRFDARRPPLLRTVVLEEPRRTILVLCAHHSIADGLSLNYWMRDLLLAVTGHGIEDRFPCPSLETMVARQLCIADLPAPAILSPTRPPIRYRSAAFDTPHVEFLSLDTVGSAGLVTNARKHGSTVHGAFSAAVTSLLRRKLSPVDGGPLQIFSPIDVRRRLLDGADDLRLCAAGAVIQDNSEASSGWEKASHFSRSLAPAKTPAHVASSVGALNRAMKDTETVSEAAGLFASMLSAEIVLTNLGRLDLRTDYGVLRLEAIYGPFVNLGFEQERCIAVCELNGRIHLSYTSFDPCPLFYKSFGLPCRG